MRILHRITPGGSGLRHARAGGIFNYYLMYLMLTGVMMGSVGLTLHLVLRSGTGNDETIRHLRQIGRLEEQLRSDAREAVSLELQDATLRIVMPDDELCEWTAEGHVVHRRVTRAGSLNAQERYLLKRQTIVNILPEQPGFVVVRIEEPRDGFDRRAKATIADDETADVSAAQKSAPTPPRQEVQILLGPVGRSTEEARI